jgi:hypothetical protein
MNCLLISATVDDYKLVQQISERPNIPARLVQDIAYVENQTSGATHLRTILPKPTTRPLTDAAIGAVAPSASERGSRDFDKSDSIMAGVGGGDEESNLNEVGTPNSPGGTTVTMILAPSCLQVMNSCRCWSRNISSRLAGAVWCDDACNSHPDAAKTLWLT